MLDLEEIRSNYTEDILDWEISMHVENTRADILSLINEVEQLRIAYANLLAAHAKVTGQDYEAVKKRLQGST